MRVSTYPQITDMSVADSAIEGLCVITLKQVTDERGTVREYYRQSSWLAAGLPDLGPFLQLNLTETRRGGVRGMHAEDMVKVVTIAAGSAFGAYVDLRPTSPTAGKVVTVDLRPGVQVLVPRGVGNGFQALEEGTQYLYGFESEWVPGMAGQAVTPLDPALGLDWPLPIDTEDRAMLSVKDRDAPLLAAVLT
ncbi:MAG: dTDP-4-dehydrorhamnose 35-epimerase related [Frankiales bacterium]|nr:dTDP-4-dehydrorhamnose 35-epimerase related [Frankiales bacterium]